MPIFKREPDPPPAPQGPPAGRPSYAAATNHGARVTTTPAVPVSPPAAAFPASAPAEPSDSDPTPQPATVPWVNRETAAVIDSKTDITGTLHSDGDVLIEGLFQGEIVAKETVLVENGAQTQGQIRANEAIISGSFDGEIVCQHRLQVAASATLSGEIKTPVLIIAEGATINCRFSMARAGR